MMLRRGVIVVLIAVVAGCDDPYAQDVARRPADSVPRAHTREPNVARAVSTVTPRSAVKAFCEQWANWDWRSIERQQRRLATLATGALARQLAAEAGLRAKDRVLRRDRLGMRGRVVAIDVRPGTSARNGVCVSWEEQLSGGRADIEGARHRVYLAAIARTPTGWAVKAWEPQP